MYKVYGVVPTSDSKGIKVIASQNFFLNGDGANGRDVCSIFKTVGEKWAIISKPRGVKGIFPDKLRFSLTNPPKLCFKCRLPLLRST